MNVSQEEYAKMLKIYKKSVQQSKLLFKLHELKSNLGRAIIDHLPETFDFVPTGKNEIYSHYLK